MSPSRRPWPAAPRADGEAATLLPCVAPQPLEALCACLAAAAPEARTGMENRRTCAPLESPAAPGLRLARVEYNLIEARHYVVHETAAGWVTVGDLDYFTVGGWNGVHNEIAFPSIKVFALGPARVARIEVERFLSDTDLGIAEAEATETTEVMFCVLEPPGGGAPSCPVTAPISYEYERDRIEGETPRPEIADLATPDMPVRRDWENEVRLSPDGVVTVERVRDSDPTAAPFRRELRLW